MNADVHRGIIAAINAPRIDGLPPGYSPVGKEDITRENAARIAEEVLELRDASAFGTERRAHVWQDALVKAHAFVGAREIATGQLVLGGFLTGSARHGTVHDIVTRPEHRRQGLATYAVDKLVTLAADYRAAGERVGMAYLEVDLGIKALGKVPLEDCFTAHDFKPSTSGLIRDYRHEDTNAPS